MCNIKRDISDNIIDARKAAGFNKRQAAEMLEMSYSTYSNYESRISVFPSVDKLFAMAKLYNTTVAALLGEGNKEPDYNEFLIFTSNDMSSYLSSEEKEKLLQLHAKILTGRKADGKEIYPKMTFI